MKKENPQIQEGFGAYEEVEGIIRRYHQYDAVISNRLSLSCFKMEHIHANKIAIEIKAEQPPREILRRFIAHAEQNFDVIVFVIASRRREIFEKTLISEKCKIYFVFEEDLINNDEIKSVLYNFDEYIAKDNNIVIEDNYPFLWKTKDNLSFAMSAGCSRNSHISDWNTLSEALGYELLYSIVDTKES